MELVGSSQDCVNLGMEKCKYLYSYRETDSCYRKMKRERGVRITYCLKTENQERFLKVGNFGVEVLCVSIKSMYLG